MRPADRRRFLATQSLPREQREVVRLKLVASNELPAFLPAEPTRDKQPLLEHWLVAFVMAAVWLFGLFAFLS